MQFSKQIILAAVAMIAPAVIQAASISSNPTLSVGGLTFDSFSCSVSGSGTLVSPSGCGEINVNTITQPGTGIQISSGFFAAKGSVDAVVDYHVASPIALSTVGLYFDGSFAGEAITKVTESVFSGGNQVGFASVECGSAGLGAGCSRTDNIVLSGSFTDLYIQKDIFLAAGSMSNASTSVIDQTFSSAAPEPSSIALMGSGLLAAGAFLRRKAKAV